MSSSNQASSLSKKAVHWEWHCCQCYSGPHSVHYNSQCLDCYHDKCIECFVLISKSARVSRDYSPSARSNRNEHEAFGGKHDSKHNASATSVKQMVPKVPSISERFSSWLKKSKIARAPPELEDMLAFPLDPVSDSSLLDEWHSFILPGILADQEAFSDLRSIHISRKGSSLEDSIPTIIVTCREITDKESLERLQLLVMNLFNKTDPQTLRISFAEATLRRAVNLNDPPICHPRNIEGQLFPSFGSSIGTRGISESTATLGGFLVVEGELLLLTVDHLIDESGDTIDHVLITHPSRQERVFFKPKYKISHRMKLLETCCAFCKTLSNTDTLSLLDMMDLYDPPNYDCATAQFLQKAIAEDDLQGPRLLGTLRARSDMRSRRDSNSEHAHETEMDWALFRVDKWPKSIDTHAQEISTGLCFREVVPGAHIQAIGRTSGHQEGVIDTARSLINHGTRMTLEWTVIPQPGSSLESWVVGGIGVDGDSGAWIIDKENGGVYGMAWGRHGPFHNPYCLFTPMELVIEDIKERTGAQKVCLPRQEVEDIGKGKGKGIERLTVPINSKIISENEIAISAEDGGIRAGGYPRAL